MLLLKRKLKYSDYLITWFDMHKKTIKDSTAANYSLILYDYIIPQLGNMEMNKITHNNIQEYLYELSTNGRIKGEGGLSKSTLKKVVIIIKLSLSQAIREGIIDEINLKFTYPPDNSINKVEVFTKKEQNVLVAYITKNITNKNIGILIALLTGIRIGELCALQWKDIDLKNNLISITKTLQRIYQKNQNEKFSKILIATPKTKKSVREIPISTELSRILKSIKKEENNYILSGTNNPFEPRTIRQYYSRMLEKISLRKLKFHCLRHTFATNCIELNVDYKTVSELLGHSSVSTTLDLYVHTKLSQKQRCINLLSNCIKNIEI